MKKNFKHSLAVLIAASSVSAQAADLTIRFCGGDVFVDNYDKDAMNAAMSSRSGAATVGTIFKKIVEETSKGRIEVQLADTIGAKDNLEFVFNSTTALNAKDQKFACDMGVSRKDVLYHAAKYMPAAGNIGSLNTFVALDDGLNNGGLDPKKDLMANEIMREYPLLICNRNISIDGQTIDDVKDFKSFAKKQQEKLGEINAEANKLRGKIGALEYSTNRSVSEDKKLAEMRQELQQKENELVTIEANRAEIIFVSDNPQNDSALDLSGGSVLWDNFIQLDSGYKFIKTKRISNVNYNRSPVMVALDHVRANANSCYMYVDRIGPGSFLSAKNADKSFYSTFKLIELNDWDFNNGSVGSEKVYEFVDITGSKLLNNLRSAKPQNNEGGILNFFRSSGRKDIETLFLKTQIITTSAFMKKVNANNDAAYKLAIQSGIKAVKYSLQNVDPIFLDSQKKYVERISQTDSTAKNYFMDGIKKLGL